MKITKKILFGIALALMCSSSVSLEAQDLYVANYDTGTIGEYGLNGSSVNASLITGSDYPV